MKLSEKSPDIIVSGNISETMFGMDDSSQHIVFDVLRSKVYKNPKGSLCREIASNGRDAQREINDDTTPIEIEIADGRDDFFYIDGLNLVFRDRGIGLSPERIKKVYSLYGASTKRHTNKQTGGFGLGAKTPFAYCDAFTVRTIVDGVEYIYSVYIDETKKGKIALLVEQPIEFEGNMTEVIVPIKHGDIGIFEKEVIRNTHFWPVRPKLINFNTTYREIEKKKFGFKDVPDEVPGEYFILEYREFIESPIGAVIDGIYYPVDCQILGYDMSNTGVAFMFEFDNGEIEVGASREQLQYTDETIAILKSKMDALLAKFRVKYDELIADCPNLFLAQMKFVNLNSDDKVFRMLNNNKDFFYTLPNGSKRKLNKHESWEPRTSQVFTCSRAGGVNFRTDKRSLSNMFQNVVEEHFDNLYIITAKDRREHKCPMINSINQHLMILHNGKFVVFLEDDAEYYKERTYGSHDFADRKKADTDKFDELGFKFKRYWDVVVPKNAPKIRPKKETVVLKTFFKDNFTREDYKYDNGYFYDLHGNKVDLVYYYSDYEAEIKNGSVLTAQLKEMSKIMVNIKKTTKIVVASKLKMKYFEEYESIEDVLKRNADIVQRCMDKAAFHHEVDTAKELLNLGIDCGAKTDLEYLVSLSGINTVERTYVSKFIQERMPKFGLVSRNFKQAFTDIKKEYPLMDQMYSSAKKDYVKMVHEMRGYKKRLRIK